MPLVTTRNMTPVRQAFRPSNGNLGRRVIHGAGFTFLGIAVRTAITIGSMSILARLLSPADFGHVAMATVVTELAALFANFGFGSILIQRPRVTRLQLDTVFWASAMLGVILTVSVFLLSYASTLLFDDAASGPLLQVLCFTFVLDEMTVVPNAVLARLLSFRKLFFVQLIVLPCRAGVAIALAWGGLGVWSLVIGALAGSATQLAALAGIAGYRPRLRFSRAFLASTWKTNGSYFGGGFLFYLNCNVDLAIIGRSLGAAPLGYYQNARALADEVRARIATPLQRVLFPAFSAMQDDRGRFREGVARSGRLLALTVIPIGLGLAAVAEELVPLLYGRQWLDMIPILQIVAIGSGVRAATSIGGPVFYAMDAAGRNFRLNLAATIAFIASIALGSRWGVLGVAWASLVSASYPVAIYASALRLIGLPGAALARILGAPLIAGTIMMMAVASLRSAIAAFVTQEALRLAVLASGGAIAYVLCIVALSRRHRDDALAVLARLRRHDVQPAAQFDGDVP